MTASSSVATLSANKLPVPPSPATAMNAFLASMVTAFRWAWMDMRCKYRRSMIGPFWETINVFVILMGMSYVSSSIFGNDTVETIPYVGLGIIAWSLIAGIITESTGVFVSHREQIRNLPLRLDLYVGRTIFRVFINFCHHLLLYVLGLILLPIPLGLVSLEALIGVGFILLNALWIVPAFGLLCARFRDLEMIIRNLLQLTFFVTPIFWHHDLIRSDRVFVVQYNPVYYFLEAVRAPLLGHSLPVSHYEVMMGITAAGFLLLALIYRSMRRNLAFYV